MISRDSWKHSYLSVRCEILGFVKDELMRKHLPRMFFIDQERNLGGWKTIRYRRSLNHKPCRLEIGSRQLETLSARCGGLCVSVCLCVDCKLFVIDLCGTQCQKGVLLRGLSAS